MHGLDYIYIYAHKSCIKLVYSLLLLTTSHHQALITKKNTKTERKIKLNKLFKGN